MNFRGERKKAGMSVDEVCAAMHVSRYAIYMWESGRELPRARKLSELARLYGCTIDELFKEEENPWAQS